MATRLEGHDFEITYQLVAIPEAAATADFRGSPTVLINDNDPFAEPDAMIGLSCRVYRNDEGYTGSPTLAQLRDAIRAVAPS